MDGVALASKRQQRLTQRDESVEVIGVAVEQVDEQRQRFGRPAQSSAQRRELERRLGIRWYGVQRRDKLLFGATIVSLRLEQSRQLESHHSEVRIQLQGVPVRGDRAVAVAQRVGDVADALMNVGPHRRDAPCLLERRERRGRIAGIGARGRDKHQQIDVVRMLLRQALRERPCFVGRRPGCPVWHAAASTCEHQTRPKPSIPRLLFLERVVLQSTQALHRMLSHRCMTIVHDQMVSHR